MGGDLVARRSAQALHSHRAPSLAACPVSPAEVRSSSQRYSTRSCDRKLSLELSVVYTRTPSLSNSNPTHRAGRKLAAAISTSSFRSDVCSRTLTSIGMAWHHFRYENDTFTR